MPDRRPFTSEDDAFMLRESAAGATARELAARLRRSAASIEGRLKNLRAETSRSDRGSGSVKGAPLLAGPRSSMGKMMGKPYSSSYNSSLTRLSGVFR